LKARREMGEKGIVFSLLVRNQESGRIISGPEIISKGLAHESMEGFILEEAKRVAQKVVRDHEAQLAAGNYGLDLQESLRVELRRFFNQNIGKKPVVLPIILDL
jgi:ribonuclease J